MHHHRSDSFMVYDFPNPEQADPEGEGLICIGGDLKPTTLLSAYSQGLFPWFNEDEPICWWSPDPRCIMLPQQFKPSKSLIRNMKKFDYQIRVDQAFEQVIQHCAAPRSYSEQTWISQNFIENYVALHQLGVAHSIEIWEDDTLIGGLYGLNLGRGFFGESMFNTRTDTSKMAYFALMQLAITENFPWIDCQLPNDHLMHLGAITISRQEFLKSLKKVIHQEKVDWQRYQNSVFSSKDLALYHTLQPMT